MAGGFEPTSFCSHCHPESTSPPRLEAALGFDHSAGMPPVNLLKFKLSTSSDGGIIGNGPVRAICF